MLKQAGPKSDAGGKTIKPKSALKGRNCQKWQNCKTDRASEIVQALKPAGPRNDTGGKNGKTGNRDKMVNWKGRIGASARAPFGDLIDSAPYRPYRFTDLPPLPILTIISR